MARTHMAQVPIIIYVGRDESEIVTEIEFTISPGSPATWTDPSDPAEIEFISVWLRFPIKDSPGHFSHEPAPEWLESFLTNSDAVYEKCGDAADWGRAGPDPDEMYERSRDERLTP